MQMRRFLSIQEGRHFDPTPAGAKKENNNAAFSVPFCGVPSHFYRSFRYFFKSTSCKMLGFTRRANFLMFSAAYLFMSRRQNAWFIVRRLGVAAREAVMFLLFSCCLSCTAAVSLQPAVRSPWYAPSGSVPFIISFETFIWSLWGISPLDSWHSQWKTSLIYREAYSQEKTRSAPTPPSPSPPRPAMWNSLMVYITSEGFSPVFWAHVWKKKSKP